MEMAVDQLQTMTEWLSDVRRWMASGAVSPQLVIDLCHLADQVELTKTLAVDALAERTVFGDLGYGNQGGWMAGECGTTHREAAVRQRQAACLRSMRLFAGALEDGRIGMAHLRPLVEAVTSARLTLALRDEQTLLNCALTLNANEFTVTMRQWMALCDDELKDPTDSDALHRRRGVKLYQLPDGSWRLEGTLEPLAGEAMAGVLNAFMPAASPGDDRTVVQRRHDTLHDVMVGAMDDRERPVEGRSRPNVTVTLHGESGVAVTGGGVVLPDHLRDMVCCDATMTPVWMSRSGVPFDAGTPHSSVPLRNRRATVARDGCCRFPGCGRAARWCDVHHLHWRCNGGRHQLTNLALLCKFHHRFVHREGVKMWMDEDELTLMVEWPNGKLRRSPPAPSLVT